MLAESLLLSPEVSTSCDPKGTQQIEVVAKSVSVLAGLSLRGG